MARFLAMIQTGLDLFPGASPDARAVMSSLFLHDSSDRAVEGVLRLLGVVHLYRASGMHLLAFFIYLDWFLVRIGRRLQISARHAGYLITGAMMISVLWIWSLQGFHLSLMRPILTFFIRKGFRLRGTRIPPLLPVVLTLMLEWVITHSQGLSPGAIHYYLAVSGSLIALERARESSPLRLHILMAVSSWIPGAMIDLLRDHVVSFMTPFWSLLMIPPLSLVLYPITLGSLIMFGHVPVFINQLWNGFMKGLIRILEWSPHFAVITRHSIWIGCLLAVIVMIFALSTQRSRSDWKFALFPLLLFLALVRLALMTLPTHRVAQLDVGQGDSALVQKGEINELIDVGSARYQSAEQWIRRLAKYGVLHLDGILLTHLDEDHIGGLKHLLPVLKVECVELNEHLRQGTRALNELRWLYVHFPKSWVRSEGCVTLEKVRWFYSNRKGAKGNEWMAGMVHELSHTQAYFALGDGDRSQELSYQKVFNHEIIAHPDRIWKVGHHGSKYSSDPEFLSALHPSHLWISVGAKNPYRHPSKETLLRLALLSGRIQRTDVEGDLIVDSRE